MTRLDRSGFTLAETIVALLLGALLILGLAHLTDGIDRLGAATRSGGDARALEWTTERVLRRAVEEAGAGMPSAPNLGGVGVRVATAADGTPLDTLTVLSGDGEPLAVATRGCPGAPGACIALVGDRRSRLTAGDLIVVGTRGTGLAAFQLDAAPAVFYAPCAGDCPERLSCSARPRPADPILRVVGSLREPGGIPSDAPCAQPFLADGSRCEEVTDTLTNGIGYVPACSASGPAQAFTELRIVDRTAALGFPAAPAPLMRSGTGGVPLVRAVRVRASRFWTRGGAGADSLLVRQNGLDASGAWNHAVVIAGPVRGLRVETLQDGAWVAGAGVAADDLVPSAANPNYVWRAAPDASGREPGSAFLRGHHRIAAVRVRYLYRTASQSNGLPVAQEARIVVSTPALLDGGTGDPL